MKNPNNLIPGKKESVLFYAKIFLFFGVFMFLISGISAVNCTADPDEDDDNFDAEACGGEDCNDNNQDINPEATEICDNGIDDDCDGNTDVDDSQCEAPEITNLEIGSNPVYTGDEVTLSFGVSGGDYTIEKIVVDWDDGDEDEIDRSDVDSSSKNLIYHTYEDSGDYDIKLSIETQEDIDDVSDSVDIEVKADAKPYVEILSPENNKIIKVNSVDFKLKMSDDQKLVGCDFKLFSNSSGEKKEEYKQNLETPSNTEYTVSLNGFEDKTYFAELSCEDNRSQKTLTQIKFTMDIEAFKANQEANRLIDSIENFTKKQDSLPLEQKKAIDNLDLFSELKFNKKRLNQIEIELNKNKGIKSENSSNDEKIQEYVQEMDEIKKQIPENIETLETEKFMKNQLSESFKQILEEYIEGKRYDLNGFQKAMLIDKNKEIQTRLSTSAELTKLKVIYPNKTKTLTVVTKQIKVPDKSLNTVLEVIPEISQEPVFKKEPEKITEEIYEISLDNLENNELVYYFNKEIDFSELKDSETFLFKKFKTQGVGLVGFATYDVVLQGNSMYVSWAIIILALGLIIWMFFIKKKQLTSKEAISKINDSVKIGIKAVKNEDIETARENYKEIRDVYREMEKEAKKSVYPKLMKLRVEIDKRDIRDLIKEYKQLKKNKKQTEADEIYEKIKDKYTRLPKKYQKQIKQRVLFR